MLKFHYDLFLYLLLAFGAILGVSLAVFAVTILVVGLVDWTGQRLLGWDEDVSETVSYLAGSLAFFVLLIGLLSLEVGDSGPAIQKANQTCEPETKDEP